MSIVFYINDMITQLDIHMGLKLEDDVKSLFNDNSVFWDYVFKLRRPLSGVIWASVGDVILHCSMLSRDRKWLQAHKHKFGFNV